MPINSYPHEQLTPAILDTLAEMYRIEVNPIRAMTRGMYDLQFERIKLGQRIVGQYKRSMGGEPGKNESDTISKEDMKILKKLKGEYRKMMDGVKNVRLATFKATPLISSYAEFCLMQTYEILENDEEHCKKRLGEVLQRYPIYTEYLSRIHGIGVTIAGVIVSEINIVRAQYVSSLWEYAGIGVKEDGRGTSRRVEHRKVIEYVNRKGETKERLGTHHNAFLKSKLMFVMAGCLIKSRSPRYKTIYSNQKARLEGHAFYGVHNDGKMLQQLDRNGNPVVYQDPGPAAREHYSKADIERIGTPVMVHINKMHRHWMAMRYMVKMFLQDLYPVWREMENLPVSLPYAQAKLGRPPHSGSEPGVFDVPPPKPKKPKAGAEAVADEEDDDDEEMDDVAMAASVAASV